MAARPAKGTCVWGTMCGVADGEPGVDTGLQQCPGCQNEYHSACANAGVYNLTQGDLEDHTCGQCGKHAAVAQLAQAAELAERGSGKRPPPGVGGNRVHMPAPAAPVPAPAPAPALEAAPPASPAPAPAPEAAPVASPTPKPAPAFSGLVGCYCPLSCVPLVISDLGDTEESRCYASTLSKCTTSGLRGSGSPRCDGPDCKRVAGADSALLACACCRSLAMCGECCAKPPLPPTLMRVNEERLNRGAAPLCPGCFGNNCTTATEAEVVAAEAVFAEWSQQRHKHLEAAWPPYAAHLAAQRAGSAEKAAPDAAQAAPGAEQAEERAVVGGEGERTPSTTITATSPSRLRKGELVFLQGRTPQKVAVVVSEPGADGVEVGIPISAEGFCWPESDYVVEKIKTLSPDYIVPLSDLKMDSSSARSTGARMSGSAMHRALGVNGFVHGYQRPGFAIPLRLGDSVALASGCSVADKQDEHALEPGANLVFCGAVKSSTGSWVAGVLASLGHPVFLVLPIGVIEHAAGALGAKSPPLEGVMQLLQEARSAARPRHPCD